MDRRSEILKFIDREMQGVEIGPWNAPLAPKASGYRCLVMDVFDTALLRQRASQNPAIPAESVGLIEEVDLLGPANALADLLAARGLLGRLDYVISSHNIEHVADPVSFFQGCARALRPGGLISMAVPDRRACFDYFRPFTALREWLQAHLERRTRPTEAQVFELGCLGADYDRGDGTRSAGFDLTSDDPSRLVPSNQLRAHWSDWKARHHAADEVYRDTHCWAFTPSSFELLVRDCRHLGLLPFELIELTPTRGHEFYVHLRQATAEGDDRADAGYLQQRQALLHRTVSESGSNSLECLELRRRLSALEGAAADEALRLAELERRLADSEQQRQELQRLLAEREAQLHSLATRPPPTRWESLRAAVRR